MRTVAMAALIGCLLLAEASGDSWDKKSVLTVNETIQVPGATLARGKYVLKLVDSAANRHIVRVMNERENEVITTILAIPNWRLKPTGATEFSFWETPAGNPRALRAWFYPGDNFGQEFAYPRGLATQIAESVAEPVPAISEEPIAETELATVPVTTVEKKPEPAAPPVVAQVTPTPAPPTPEFTPAAVPTEMRKTASLTPWLLLGSALALIVGISLKYTVRI